MSEPDFPPQSSRQATLHQAPGHAQHLIQVQLQAADAVRRRTLHELGPPRRLGALPYAIMGAPTSSAPSTNPDLAFRASTRRFIDVPFGGFLGPP